MSKTLYLMRHGQTLFNERKKIQGWSDAPLTALGIKQAQVAGEYFRKAQITLEEAYSSTSERASDTLELVTDNQLSYQRVKGLKEWNFGSFEGESEDLNPPLPYNDFFVTFGGESQEELTQRISKTIFELVSTSHKENLLIVSHGAACRNFMRAWEHNQKLTLNEPLRNCCILKFTFENEQFYFQEIINHDF